MDSWGITKICLVSSENIWALKSHEINLRLNRKTWSFISQLIYKKFQILDKIF